MIPEKMPASRGVLATLFAATVAAIASSFCCIGPLLYLVFGISAAGFSGLAKLNWLQLPMIIISTGLILFGFWRLYFSSRLFCAGKITLFRMRLLYWLALPLILGFMFYPFLLSLLLETFE